MKLDRAFYKNKKVFITGHTGFKGAYICEVLVLLGAKVFGYALKEEKDSLYKLLNLKNKINTTYGDIRNYKKLYESIKLAQPDIVIHMAAQPIVRYSYKEPKYTYETNVMGTVNILEAIRNVGCVKSFINVTTDKVYFNREDNKPFKETEMLNGFDPYSNSKSCSELITSTYRQCFFNKKNIAITTCRAGNVIGGGDFAKDRIIPDAMRAIVNNRNIIIRNPNSVRPYQHVLEPVTTYLYIAMKQYLNKGFEGAYNIGPDNKDCITTRELITKLVNAWNSKNKINQIKYVCKNDNGPHEANFLKLDCDKVKKIFKYKCMLDINDTIIMIVDFIYELIREKKNIKKIVDKQIIRYIY